MKNKTKKLIARIYISILSTIAAALVIYYIYLNLTLFLFFINVLGCLLLVASAIFIAIMFIISIIWAIETLNDNLPD